MMKERNQRKGFGKDVGCHVGCGDPCCCERAVVEMLADEVMMNIYMFGSGRYYVGIGDSACALVVAIYWERSRRWEECEGKE